MLRLDPTLDLVFKLMLTRELALLHDMLQGILARPIRDLWVANPDIPGEQVRDRRVIFDIRAHLHDGTRADVEMQRTIPPRLSNRFVYYTARDYSGQLRRGDPYHLLTPTTGIVWVAKPLFPDLRRLHSTFELRDFHTGTRFSDQLAIHLLQLPYLSPSGATGYTGTVERWARFFTARSDDALDQLAREHPIMHLAKQTLDELSLDSETRRRAREREDEIMLYEIGMAATRAEGKAEGKAELLLKLLGLRFGPLDDTTRARVEAASPERVDAWAERVLTAPTLDDALAI